MFYKKENKEIDQMRMWILFYFLIKNINMLIVMLVFFYFVEIQSSFVHDAILFYLFVSVY